MAPRLQSSDNKVVQLKPRKARGAKSSGGRKPTSRLKVQPGEPKVAAPKQPSDAEVRRNTQDRLVALRNQLMPVERKKAAAQEALGEIRESEKQIRASIQTIIPLAIYDEADKKLKLKTKRSDQELYEKQRALAFEAFGLAAGPQAELELQGVPEAARPGLHWRSVGYQAAINGEFSDIARDGVPPEGIQEYQAGFGDGTAANARGIKALKADEKAKKTAPQLPPASIPGGEAKAAAKAVEQPAVVGVDPGAGEQSILSAGDFHIVTDTKGFVTAQGFGDDPEGWDDVQNQLFRTWFDALDENADIDITHKGLALAFDKACAGEDFEASPEELQQQNARRALEEKRLAAGGEDPAEFAD